MPFTRVAAGAPTGRRQWTDAYLLHLARRHGLSFASLDRGMASIDDPGQPTLWIIG